MNETLKMWLTPEGFMVAFAALVAIGYLAVRALRAIGKHETADALQAVLTRAETAEHALGSVMKGVQTFKLTAPPSEVAKLVHTLRETNKMTGAEVVVAPIVAELNKDPDAAPIPIVRTVTARIARRVS